MPEPSSAPQAGDGSGFTAVVDEATPEGRGGIYYVVTAAVLLDVAQVRTAIAGVLPSGRRRPFHWASEGPQARERMLELIASTGVVAHVVVHHPTGRRRQEEARRLALTELVPVLLDDGVDDLIIESRTEAQDRRDRATMLDALRAVPHGLRYRWEPKEEPLLWVADAVCGAVKQYLLGEDDQPFERLAAARAVEEIRYRQPS